jgi:hypothetical protein
VWGAPLVSALCRGRREPVRIGAVASLGGHRSCRYSDIRRADADYLSGTLLAERRITRLNIPIRPDTHTDPIANTRTLTDACRNSTY